MSDIVIENSAPLQSTVISNHFIDEYMPQANGEFVKVYLYLIRSTQGGQSFSLSSIADVLDCTERDVVRALRYWEKSKLLKLTYENRKLISLAFRQFPETKDNKKENSGSKAETPSEEKDSPSPSESKKSLTAGEKKELQEKEEVRQFLYIAEQYLGRPLTKTDVDNLLYYYAQLNFSEDLIEYLIEYCVSKGSSSARYIEAVALAWAKEGITTVKEAKASTNLYNKDYFTILKAMGVKSRNPIKAEISLMDKWVKSYGFTMDIITLACQKTIMQTGKPSFQYTDSILKDWKDKGVKHLADIQALDSTYKEEKSTKKSTVKPSSKNKFTQYPHRDYDYDEIEKSLFNQ